MDSNEESHVSSKREHLMNVTLRQQDALQLDWILGFADEFAIIYLLGWAL